LSFLLVNCSPSSSDYYSSAIKKSELKDYKGAITDCNKAIELDSQFAEAYDVRGTAKDELKDYKGALEDYNKAIEINPQYADAFYNRGIVKFHLNDIEGAIADYTKAIEINPQCAEAYINRGVRKINLEDFTRITVKRSKNVLTIKLLSPSKQYAELLFPAVKIYRFVSRQQCEIVYHRFLDRSYSWAVKDGSIAENINSSNGTFVNGVQLSNYEVKKLSHGNIISFARQTYPQIKFCDLEHDKDEDVDEILPTSEHERDFEL
jgi:tetratricopeptide (TPR) repeat protein